MLKSATRADDEHDMRRVLIGALALVALATGCGEEARTDASRPAGRPVVTATLPDGSSTTVVVLGGGSGSTPRTVSDGADDDTAPADDGGRLCAAVAALDDPSTSLPEYRTIDDLIPAAATFRAMRDNFMTLVAAAPAALQGEATQFAAQFGTVGDLLAKLGVEVAADAPGAAVTREKVTVELGRAVLDVTGTPVDGRPGMVRFENAYQAWLAPDCGPKPLVVEDRSGAYLDTTSSAI